MIIGTDYLVGQPAMGLPNWGPSRLSAEAANRANGVAVSRLAKARLGSRRSGRGNDTSFYAPCTLENHLAVRWCIENFGCSVHGQKVSEIGPLEGRLIQYGSSRGPPILRMQYLTILRGSPKCASQQSRKGTFSSSGWPHSPNMCKGVFNVRKGFVRRLNSMRPWSNGGTVTELACNNQTWQWKHIPSEDDVTCQQCSKISCWFMILGDDTIQHGNYHHPWNPQQPTSIMKWQRFFFCLAHVCHGQNLDCVPILGDGHRSINMD